MLTSVAVRRTARNVVQSAVLAPSPFVVIASRVLDHDRLAVVLRGDHVGALDGAKRHALRLLQVVAERHGDACVDVLDRDGLPLFFASTMLAVGGAS